MATTYTATRLDGPRGEIRFRSIDALVRKLGGRSYDIEHDPRFDPPNRTLMVLRKDRHGTHVLARVIVPAEAVKAGE
ncbi:hypothetical protein ABN028_19700 [Actinopolymorpha sp. B17G11]|uniref:hypothetical protein n=1 Tax=Actinopolymorpha sp. B17G11 TaxID=3160861 RepID=UPI0032E474CF